MVLLIGFWEKAFNLTNSRYGICVCFYLSQEADSSVVGQMRCSPSHTGVLNLTGQEVSLDLYRLVPVQDYIPILTVLNRFHLSLVTVLNPYLNLLTSCLHSVLTKWFCFDFHRPPLWEASGPTLRLICSFTDKLPFTRLPVHLQESCCHAAYLHLH